jgi:hypothetical protein
VEATPAIWENRGPTSKRKAEDEAGPELKKLKSGAFSGAHPMMSTFLIVDVRTIASSAQTVCTLPINSDLYVSSMSIVIGRKRVFSFLA